MSTDVERRLTEVLHRRADDAMDRTDTQEQLRELLVRVDDEHPASRRWPAVVGAALAAAAVAAAVFWGTGLTDDRTGPEPVDEPRPRAVRVAEGFVRAYAAHDVKRAESFLAPGTEPWGGWRSDLALEQTHQVDYLLEPCERLYKTALGTTVYCPFDFHALGSEERGMGPYENGSFAVRVDTQTEVVGVEPSYNGDANGAQEDIEEMWDWMKRVYVYDYPLMKRDYEELSADQKVVWTRMWTEHIQKYIETH
jgi:hypothetical protein